MSKVLVDRELLERCVELLDLLPESRTIVGVRAILAQPAEAEGVDFGFDDRSVKVSQEAYSIFLERERYLREDLSTERTRADVAVADANDAERALSAVTAERDRLLEHTAKAQQHALDMGNKALAANQLVIEVRGVVYQSYIDRCDPEAAGECLAKIDTVIAAMDAKEE